MRTFILILAAVALSAIASAALLSPAIPTENYETVLQKETALRQNILNFQSDEHYENPVPGDPRKDKPKCTGTTEDPHGSYYPGLSDYVACMPEALGEDKKQCFGDYPAGNTAVPSPVFVDEKKSVVRCALICSGRELGNCGPRAKCVIPPKTHYGVCMYNIGKSSCFSKDSYVINDKKEKVLITDLKPGDQIFTYNKYSNQPEQTEFLDYAHINHSVTQQFVKIYLENKDHIKITKDHQIYEEHKGYIPSMQIKQGDYVRYMDLVNSTVEKQLVTKIELVQDVGIYAPMTSSGHLMVNSVFVSVYANVDYQWMGDYIALGAYKFQKRFGLFSELTNEKNEEGILKQFELIDNLRNKFVPEFIYKKY